MAHRLSISQIARNSLTCLLLPMVGIGPATADELTLSRSLIYSVLDLPQGLPAMNLSAPGRQYLVANPALGAPFSSRGASQTALASVAQSGTSNIASADQNTGDTLTIVQAGNQNVATVMQGGWTGAVVRQTGNENAATVQLSHAGGHLELTQTGKQKIFITQY